MRVPAACALVIALALALGASTALGEPPVDENEALVTARIDRAVMEAMRNTMGYGLEIASNKMRAGPSLMVPLLKNASSILGFLERHLPLTPQLDVLLSPSALDRIGSIMRATRPGMVGFVTTITTSLMTEGIVCDVATLYHAPTMERGADTIARADRVPCRQVWRHEASHGTRIDVDGLIDPESATFECRSLRAKSPVHVMTESLMDLVQCSMWLSAHKRLTSVASGLADLGSAIKSFAGGWSDFAAAFRSTSSTTIRRIVRGLGFRYFKEQSDVYFFGGLERQHLSQAIGDIAVSLGMTHIEQLKPFLAGASWTSRVSVWDNNLSIYTRGDGSNHHLQVMISPNSTEGTADVVLFSISADFQIAPDLLVVTTDRSFLGGIWQDHSEKIVELPKDISLNDMRVLTYFCQILAMSGVADRFGIPIPDFPKLE